jgi:hypothetical protein
MAPGLLPPGHLASRLVQGRLAMRHSFQPAARRQSAHLDPLRQRAPLNPRRGLALRLIATPALVGLVLLPFSLCLASRVGFRVGRGEVLYLLAASGLLADLLGLKRPLHVSTHPLQLRSCSDGAEGSHGYSAAASRPPVDPPHHRRRVRHDPVQDPRRARQGQAHCRADDDARQTRPAVIEDFWAVWTQFPLGSATLSNSVASKATVRRPVGGSHWLDQCSGAAAAREFTTVRAHGEQQRAAIRRRRGDRVRRVSWLLGGGCSDAVAPRRTHWRPEQ